MPDSNPLLAKWDTPFGLPPFSEIEEAHFKPAFTQAVQAQRAEIDAIAANNEPATFDNTVLPLEHAGAQLRQVIKVFANITNTDTTDVLEALESEIWPLMSRESDAIYMNPKLYARVKTVFDARDALPDADRRLVELTYRDFVRCGAGLGENAKAEVGEINARLSSLTTRFSQNLLKSSKMFELVIEDEADLAGLSDSLVSAGKAAAKKKGKPDAWVFGLDRAIFEGFMTQSERPLLRARMLEGYRTQGVGGDVDNNALILEIVKLRAKKAKLMGYESHAHFQLETRMAKTPETVEQFLLQVWKPGLARAQREIAQMQVIAPDGETISRADWWHYAEKLRQKLYDFDDAMLKPFFSMENVRRGAFETASRLFGISFEKADVTGWHPDVEAFDVRDEQGAHIGLFLVDNFARDSKRGGAWMSTYRDSSVLGDAAIRPIVTNNLNLIQPSDDAPVLMSFDEVETLFHEFGHALHALLSKAKYARYSGTAVPTDFVEFPSQVMEHWAAEEELLNLYAKHHETGEVISSDLLARLHKASTHNQGFQTTEYIAASLLDLAWHKLTLDEASQITDVQAFEDRVLKAYGLIDEIGPRYRSTYFSHIFAGGYSAGYYAYLWSEVLDADGFTAFKETGDIFNADLAGRLKSWVFEAGDSMDSDELYRRFRGSEPSIAPLLEMRGLN